jgi:hypothetical protein
MLNDREQRALAELEQQLTSTDPSLSRWLRSGSTRSLAPLALSVMGIVFGLVLLVAGVASRLLLVSLAGVVLAGSGVFSLVDLRNRSRQLPADVPPRPNRRQS